MCKRHKSFGLVVVFLFLSTFTLPNAFSQEKFPTRPVTFLINFAPGGITDLAYRPLLEATSKILGQPTVPVNKPGASGTLAPSSLKAVKPDGYTLSVGITTLLTLPYLEDVTFDPMKDFTYIARVISSNYGIVVRSDSPWKTLKDLVEYAKQHPNEIKYSSSSPGNVFHFAMEEIAIKEGVKWNIVPFPGSAPAFTALLGGHVHACSNDIAPGVAYLQSGKLRMLASYGGTEKAERLKRYPDVPTLVELGYSNWLAPLGIVGPAGMDKNVVRILENAFKKGMEDPTFLKTVDMMESNPAYLGSDDYDRFMRENYSRFGEIIRKIGLEKKK